MRILVLSDLHITGPDDRMYGSLLMLLENDVRATDTLILAGDIFDLFVGDKALFRERYSQALDLLKKLAEAGTAIHYIEGNHDFLLRQTLKERGIQLHESEVEIAPSGGPRFYIAHGDLVDRSDRAYLALRSFYRSFLFRSFVRIAPDAFIDWLGKALSDQSRKRKPLLVQELPIDRRERLRKVYRSFSADLIVQGHDVVILGHCHDLDEFSFQVDGRIGHYFNMGYPKAHGSYLLWTPGDDRPTRKPFPSISQK